MTKIAIVYTSLGGLIQTMKKEFARAMPGCTLINIADDSLIREVMEEGAVTEGVRERMMHYFQAAANCNPQVIVSACSSVGEVAEEADQKWGIPVVRIDHAMIEKALEEGNRIGVLASLGTTMEPTVSYIRRLAADRGREVQGDRPEAYSYGHRQCDPGGLFYVAHLFYEHGDRGAGSWGYVPGVSGRVGLGQRPGMGDLRNRSQLLLSERRILHRPVLPGDGFLYPPSA